MTHDPLCLADPTTTNERCHYCSLIARVREDERSNNFTPDDHADAMTQARAAALRDAVEAVRQYRDDTHRHVGVFACIPDKGDRCGMTAALTVAAQRVEALGGEDARAAAVSQAICSIEPRRSAQKPAQTRNKSKAVLADCAATGQSTSLPYASDDEQLTATIYRSRHGFGWSFTVLDPDDGSEYATGTGPSCEAVADALLPYLREWLGATQTAQDTTPPDHPTDTPF